MSCYTRHLREQIRAAGLADDAAGHREADRRIRAALRLLDADCPAVWRMVKTLEPEDVQRMLEA